MKVLCIGGSSDGAFVDWPTEVRHGARCVLSTPTPIEPPSREYNMRIDDLTMHEAYYLHQFQCGDEKVFIAANCDYSALTVLTTLAENYANKNERY